MKYLYLFSALFCISQIAIGSWELQLNPKGRPFRMTFADPREIRMALSFEGGSRINASIGNYFSLLGIRSIENPDLFFHIGLEGAGYFTMKQADQRFPLETADGLIGFYTETSVGQMQYQFRLTHISAHLADGSSEGAIAYSRETAVLKVGYLLNSDTHLYSGVHFIVNSTPIVPNWTFQLGATSFFPLRSHKVVPYGGFDLKQKGESSTHTSMNLQLGIAFGNPLDAYRSFKFFYSYYTGADPRGQFFKSKITTHSAGIEMQI